MFENPNGSTQGITVLTNLEQLLISPKKKIISKTAHERIKKPKNHVQTNLVQNLTY